MAEKKKYRFTKEQIKSASEISIYAYVKENGLGKIISDSGDYAKLSYMNHDSIVIDKKKNYFIHNANSFEKNAKGNLINFIQYINQNEIGFQEAVHLALKFGKSDYKVQSKIAENIESKEFEYNFKTAKYSWTLERYLTKERKIDTDLVKYLLEENYIMQDVRNNIIFNWTQDGKPPSKNNLIIGATQQLTKKVDSDNPNRYIIKNSEKYHGFNIAIGDKTNDLYVFEASIDLLSYWTLRKNELKDCRIISLEGVKDGTLFKMLGDDYTKEPRDLKVHISVDNDKAGHIFLDNHIQLEGRTHSIEYINNIPDYNTINTEKYKEIITIAEQYKLPKDLMLAFWQFDRPLIDDKKKITKVFNGNIENDFKKISELYAEKNYNQDELFKAYDLSSRQINRIKEWQDVFNSNSHILKDEIAKDWNDKLKAENFVKKKESIEEKAESIMMNEETISNYILNNTQRLNEEQIATLSNETQVDRDIIEMYAKKGWLRSEKQSKDLFLVWGKDGEIVGANKLTSDYQIATPFKGSSSKDSFIVTIGDRPKDIILFEQPLDSLEYITSNRNQINNCVLICSREGDLSKQYTIEKVNEYLKTSRVDNIDIISKSDNSEKIKSNIINHLEFENKGKNTMNFDFNIESKQHLNIFDKTL